MNTTRRTLCLAVMLIALGMGIHLAIGARMLGSGRAQEFTIQIGNEQRMYIVQRPAAAGPLPTLLFLHGRNGSAERMQFTDFGQLGFEQDMVTVFPNAIDGVWNVFPSGFRVSGPTGGNDVAFIKQLVTDLIARGIADPSRIYMSGISFGGFMTLRMACVEPQLFAAIGVVLASMLDADGVECHPSRPMPLVMVNTTDDPTVPYAGGSTPGGYKVWGTDRTVAFFRRLNGCEDTPTQRANVPHSQWEPPVTVSRWTNCSGAPVVLYSVFGGGHRPPRGRDGMGPGGFSSAQALWDFFRDKTLTSKKSIAD